ncbi:MAG: hypothetical protein GWP91_01385, partial [Rhodobacterales bacterium]|nr:hypothetical protein [Rhodobacterales bacterium]
MKFHNLLFAAAFVACTPVVESTSSSQPISPYDVLSYVDPFVGTGRIGAQVTAVSPSAAAPFGMTLIGPDTRHSTLGIALFYHMAGYHYDDDQIDGFSHTHSHGMGVGEYGGVMIMPRGSWSDTYTTDAGRSAPFTHEQEAASPGQYSVLLQDDDTQVDIVATRHGAHHRYQFADGQQPVVLMDLGHFISTVNIAEANIELDLATGTMHAFQLLQGGYSARFDGLQTHIEVQVDPMPVAVGAWSDPDDPQAGLHNAVGNTSGGWFEFPVGTTQVDVRVSLSYVDAEGALANLQAEMPDTNFDARVTEVRQAWTDELSLVRVGGGTETDMRTFHTAQYHTMLMPRRFDDVDGRYRGVDGQVHTSEHPYYTDFSLWDTFRTSHPWYVMAQPQVQRDMVQSLVQMNRDGGDVPRWPLGHGYTGGMVGTPADQVFAETYL